MSYEQRLKDLAEKLAKEWHKPPTGAFRFGPVERELIKQENRSISIETMLPLAEICLAEIVEQSTWFYTQGWVDGEEGKAPIPKDYLQELGLIPVE